MRLFGKIIGSLGQTFTLALMYVLASLALSAHLSGPDVVLGTEVFRDALPSASTAQTAARVIACVATVAYFLAVGRYLAPLVLRWLGTDRGLGLTTLAIAALFLIVTVPAVVVGGLAAYFGGAVFVDALWQFLLPSPYWAVLIPIAGFASGLRKPLPPGTPRAPPEVDAAFEALATGLLGIAEKIETALSSSLDILSGGFIKVTFAYLGLNALAAALAAEAPVTQALIFWLPLAFALRDVFVLYMIRVIYPTLDKGSSGGLLTGCYVIVVFLLSLLLLLVTVTAANLVLDGPALDLSLYGSAFLAAPFGAGLGVTMTTIFVPAGLMAVAFIGRPGNGGPG